MPAKRQISKERVESEITETLWLWLLDEIADEDLPDVDDGFNVFMLTNTPELRAVAEQYMPQILAAYIRAHPGRRPRVWWQYCAPEERRQVGGRMAKRWVRSVLQDSPWSYEHNGERGFWFEESDPKDPPTVESQATYLKRLNLLTAAEQKRLARKDFKAEVQQ